MSGAFANIAAGIAAALYALGCVWLFIWRSMRHKAATGTYGFNGLTRTRTPTAKLAGVCFAVAVVVGLVAPTLAALGRLPLIWPAENAAAPWIWLGLLATAVGFVAAAVAQNTMGTSWRIGVDQAERTELVTYGVFAQVRNPIFTSMIAAQFGTALIAPTWLSITGVALLGLGCGLQVRRVEEPYLIRTHGQTYLDYAARTGRFLPRMGRLAAEHSIRPSVNDHNMESRS